jgi:hypothetical protein
MDLPLLKNDITGSELALKYGIHSRYQQLKVFAISWRYLKILKPQKVFDLSQLSVIKNSYRSVGVSPALHQNPKLQYIDLTLR